MKSIKRTFPIWICVPVLALFLSWPPSVLSEQEDNPKDQPGTSLPVKVEDSLSYLLSLADHKDSPFDIHRVNPLLDFTTKAGADVKKLQPGKRESGKGVCMRIEIGAPLERILRYAYNPDIPNFVVFPSVLRLSGWYPESDIVTGNIEPWKELDKVTDPLLLWGREFEVNTPDTFGGAYYRYDMDRLIALMNHRQGRVFVSVSKMSGKSRVGRKAVIIDDKNWNYFYSGIQGLNLNLIGGMDTYMYDSESVSIMYEAGTESPRTVLLLFKWLKAGWRGINVVQPDHIYEGCVRFVRGIKTVMESETLPDPDTFARQVAHIKTLPDTEIDSKIREYALNFERIAKDHKGMYKKDFSRIIADGGYADVLNHEERIGVLILEILKSHVGKPTLVKLDFPSSLEKPLNNLVSLFPAGKSDS